MLLKVVIIATILLQLNSLPARRKELVWEDFWMISCILKESVSSHIQEISVMFVKMATKNSKVKQLVQTVLTLAPTMLGLSFSLLFKL